MPLTPEERTDLTRMFMFVWANAWGRYRALIAVMAAHGHGSSVARAACDADARQARWTNVH